jgi:hypothetical protein
MKTRSMTTVLDVNIDFDAASIAWKSNKIRVGQIYIYICGVSTKNGTPCKKLPLTNCDHCYLHQNIMQ